MAGDQHRATRPKDRGGTHAEYVRRAKHAGYTLVEHCAERYPPLGAEADERESCLTDDDRAGG